MFDEARQKPNSGGSIFSLGCVFTSSFLQFNPKRQLENLLRGTLRLMSNLENLSITKSRCTTKEPGAGMGPKEISLYVLGFPDVLAPLNTFVN